MKFIKVPVILAGVLLSVTASCKSGTNADSRDAVSSDIDIPLTQALGHFNSDSAFNFIADQVAFGPRVPGTFSHDNCRDYIISTLERLPVDSIVVQKGEVTAFNGDKLPISNIMASFNTAAKRRVLLAAHYDTRPWADKENKNEERDKPIIGANDGASGVGVLLEIARNLAARQPAVGVDLLFVDAEDYGTSEGFGENTETWCLGSQYWTKNMTNYSDGNLPVYGILLDMVGGLNARFHYEAFSAENAPTPTIKVWSEAQALGFGDIFPRTVGGAAVDDHIFLTKAGIPTTNIIEINNIETQSFPPTWHTHADNLDNIDRSTLKAVGQTVLNVVYKEKAD